MKPSAFLLDPNLTEQQKYDELVKRIDEQISLARLNLNDAWERLNFRDVEEMRVTIASLERSKKELRKPGEPK